MELKRRCTHDFEQQTMHGGPCPICLEDEIEDLRARLAEAHSYNRRLQQRLGASLSLNELTRGSDNGEPEHGI